MSMQHPAPLNVVHVVEALRPGGAERQLVEMVRRMDRNLFRNTLVHLYEPATFGEELRELGVEIRGLALGGKKDLARGIATLQGWLSRSRPDIVHTWLYDADQVGRIAACLARVPHIVSALQSTWWAPEALAVAGAPSAATRALKQVDIFTGLASNCTYVACSHFVGRSMAAALRIDPDRIHVIPNAVDPTGMPRASTSERTLWKQESGCSDSFPILICVSRLVPPKGHAVLFEAMPRVIERFPAARLLVVGDGPERSNLQAMASEICPGGQIDFLGLRTDVGRLLQISDQFVFPSLAAEGLPVALVEAMASELPAVAWGVEPNPEVVEDGCSGVLLPRGDVKGMADAICRLAADPVRMRRMGVRSREIVEERFNINRTTLDLQAYYLKLCGRTELGISQA